MNGDFIDIVFDGPPGPEAGRFVEVEDPAGHGFKAGEWIARGDGMWALRVMVGVMTDVERARQTTLTQEVIDERTKHPSVAHVMQYFESDHLPERIREPAALCAQLARHMARSLSTNPEVTAGLRKLLEAKDCFVRAKLAKPKPEPKGQIGQ